jgi:hypothetical protein
MRATHRCTIAILLACSAAEVGCAQPGPVFGRRTTVGTLKASVSQLEFEKHELQKEVADLKADNHHMEDRLAQEEEANGDLTARLDDARTLLRSRGYEGELSAAPNRRTQADDAAPSRSAPRRPRKPPFARIPARLSPDNDGSDEDSSESTRSFDSTSLDAPRRRSTSSWLPVAHGEDARVGSVR